MKHAFSLIALVAAMPALAEDSRHLDAHEHGVGALNIAIDGTSVAMEFNAPGADIVGFEYAAESDADLAAIESAIATLGAPLDLFVTPDAAACTVTEAHAEIESEDAHEDHDGAGHGDHDDDDHDGHDGHDGHDDHDEHNDHAEDGHDDHDDHDDHDKHAEDGHEDHDKDGHEDHDDHADEARHTEFHAEYMLNCENPGALSEITFAYFELFPNAREVEVQSITASGAQAYEVTPDAPVLKLGG